MRALLTALIAALLILAAPAAAQAPPTFGLTLDTSAQIGWIGATVTGAPPARTVRLVDVTGGGAGTALSTSTAGPDGRAVVPRAAAWTCVGVRTLRAVVDGAAPLQADATIRTPACDARRIAVVLRPQRPRAGRMATVEIADRWRVGGLDVEVCDGAPGRAARDCRHVALKPGALRGAARFRVARAGRWPVVVRFAKVEVARTLKVLPRSRRLSVLAAGDSMMQLLDDDLHRRLAARGPVRVTDDAHISTGISKPFMFDWVAHAKATAAGLKPDVSVVFLGANDGFGIGDAACCGGVWQARYAKRAARMMRSYARGGRGTVYWLLLPVPKRAAFVPIYAAVNRALHTAAARFPGIVHLVDLRAVFTPGGRFRQTMTWHGKRLNVRQSDGVHLSRSGAAIAAEVVMRRMRADGLIS